MTMPFMPSRHPQIAFVGGVRRDITVIVPSGAGIQSIHNAKVPVTQFTTGWGGSVGRAALTCAKLQGVELAIMCKGSNDFTGGEFIQRLKISNIDPHFHMVRTFPLTVVLLDADSRLAFLCDAPDDDDTTWQPTSSELIPLKGYGALYMDGRLPLAAIAHAEQARALGVTTVLDACKGRAHTEQVIGLSDFVIASADLPVEMGLSPEDTLRRFRSLGCKAAVITNSEKDILFLNGNDGIDRLPTIPTKVVSANGAGDVFHACFVWSLVVRPNENLLEHLMFARAGATHAVQFVDDEKKMPQLADIQLHHYAFTF